MKIFDPEVLDLVGSWGLPVFELLCLCSYASSGKCFPFWVGYITHTFLFVFQPFGVIVMYSFVSKELAPISMDGLLGGGVLDLVTVLAPGVEVEHFLVVVKQTVGVVSFPEAFSYISQFTQSCHFHLDLNEFIVRFFVLKIFPKFRGELATFF